MYKTILMLLLLSNSSFGYAGDNLGLTINALAQEGHVFQGHNKYSSLVTFNGNIYIFSLDEDRRPYINKINELNSSVIQTKLLDKNEVDIYKVFDDTHHRFSIGIDEKGYIHVIGDMHHGGGGSGKGGSKRAMSDNPLPKRFYGGYGEQLYWISDSPEDISSFTFIGDDEQKHFPCNRTTYNYFVKDRTGQLYLAARQSVREPKSHEHGTMGLCLAKYNSDTKIWNMLGGVPESGYGFTKDLQYEVKSIVWEPHGFNKSNGSQWYQAYSSNIKFDENNRLHLTTGLNADSIHDNETHLIYAYSDDEGETFHRADGSVIESLPIRVTGNEANRASIILKQDKDNVIFETMYMGLFWDRDKNPAVTFKDISDPKNIRTSYRYYDSYTGQWITKRFGIKVESIRSDHHTTLYGDILEIGSRYQINKLGNMADVGTVYNLEKIDRRAMSKYLLREVDKSLFGNKNILRGISIINGRSAVITVAVPY